MILNVASVILILAITFLHSVFGLYSGVINAFCSIVAAVVALGFFEPVADFATAQAGIPTSFGASAAIVVLFVVTLAVLRTLADNYMRGNVHVPMYLDWGGGAVAGFINAQLAVGIMVISLTMLPFGGNVLGFTPLRVDRASTGNDGLPETRLSGVWLSPDGFTVGLVKLLSAGSLRNETTLSDVYPNFTQWIAWSGNTVQPESVPTPQRGGRGGDGYEALTVAQWWRQKNGFEVRYRQAAPTREEGRPPFKSREYKPEAGNEVLGVRVKLGAPLADNNEGRQLHLFRPTMFRVVGEENGRPTQFFPKVVGGADALLAGARRLTDADNNFSMATDGDVSVDLFFEVPEGFSPRFIEYRRFARSPLSEAQFAKKAPTGDLKLQTPDEERAANRTQGATSFAQVLTGGSGENDKLPFDMNPEPLRGMGIELEDGKMKSGRILGERTALTQRSEQRVEKLVLPSGLRLCQIRYTPKQAHSLLGRVFNYAARTINQYYAVDSTGNKHLLVGYYGLVKRGGNEYLELFYTGSAQDPAYRGMLDFQQITPSELTDSDDAEFGLLFLVPAGATIVSIENQVGAGAEGLSYRMSE